MTNYQIIQKRTVEGMEDALMVLEDQGWVRREPLIHQVVYDPIAEVPLHYYTQVLVRDLADDIAD